ncbi:MAG: HEPN domain-containing protein [Candidatus Brocadiia bacterium]
MPPERFAPDDPQEWLNRAESNIAQAKARGLGVYLEDLCFNAQQAAEKALKALLIHRNVRFPYVHDIGELLRLLEESGQTIPDDVRESKQLTDYAVETRYPGLFEPVTEEEYQQALAFASRCVEWAREQLRA